MRNTRVEESARAFDAVSMQPTLPGDPSVSRPVRLLVVDDDEGIRTLLQVTTSLDARYQLVGTAASAADALAAVADGGQAIDVVLLDVTLPDRNGIDLLADLRRAGGEGLQIALFTGWSDEETLRRATDAGADAVFGKDGDPQRLLDKLAALVAG